MLFLGFFKHHPLTQNRVELHELDFAFHLLAVLARPNDVRTLGGLHLHNAVLGHTSNLPEVAKLGNLDTNPRTLTCALLHIEMWLVVFD